MAIDITSLKTAKGEIKADIVLKNGNIINVFVNRIIKADVAVCSGEIVGVGSYEGVKEIDCTGKYILPGYIDAHMHMESTMVTPDVLSEELLKRGTTTVIADPHEMVNVKGSQAFRFLLEAVKNLAVNVFIMAPSSVPATCFDTNGSSFDVDAIKEFIGNTHLRGLGEVMCYNDVLQCNKEIIKKLDLFKGYDYVIDGHAPGLKGRELQAYINAGITTDHEASSYEEAYEKLSSGMNILIREGSGARNLEAIVKDMLKNNISFDRCAFCTDDKHLEDIVSEGHIDFCLKKAVELGLDPVTAVKTATYNAANIYKLNKVGAIAAGYKADINVVENLSDFKPCLTLKDGEIVNEEYFSKIKKIDICCELLDTVKIGSITPNSIKVKRHNKNHVIKLIDNEILTDHLFVEIPGDEYFIPENGYSKLCVVERHGRNGNIAACALQGYNIKNAAVASSVSHDSHNIVAAGDNDSDIISAVKAVAQMRGGCAIVSKGNIVASVGLPVAGLMSDKPAEIVISEITNLRNKAYSLGVNPNIDPLVSLSFVALPVIPSIRLLDTGLFDVEKFKLID